MIEQFNKAANILLSRRLNNLLRIDESVEIDMSYITCAEYQLFINEKSNSEEYRYPEHWNGYRFPHGEAKKAVTGVRAIYAEEFCEWLTQREPSSLYKYRLPNLNEAQKYLLEEKDLGYWCQDGNIKIIQGINQTKYREWEKTLLDIFSNDLKYLNDIDILFGKSTITLASKIQIILKSLQNSDIHDFVKKIYTLSNDEIEKFNFIKIINKLEELNKSKNYININSTTLSFKKFADYNKKAIFETLELIMSSTSNNFNYKKSYLENELDSILQKLQGFEQKIKKIKLYLETEQLDMKDVYDNIFFLKETIKLTNPITGQDDFVDIPAVNSQTISYFKNLKYFMEQISTIKKDIYKLQKDILETRSKFIELENSLQKEKTIYEKNLYKVPQALKLLKHSDKNHFHLLITCAISIWVEKIDLAREIFDLYLYSILLKERLENRIPAWESIRVVRERL